MEDDQILDSSIYHFVFTGLRVTALLSLAI
jgi:hypothetical protein